MITASAPLGPRNTNVPQSPLCSKPDIFMLSPPHRRSRRSGQRKHRQRGDSRGSPDIGAGSPASPLRSPSAMKLTSRDYSLEVSNPTPKVTHKDSDESGSDDEMWQDQFSAENLMALSGKGHLDDIKTLEITVDTTEQAINQVGELCPNLRELRLKESLLSSFRDLGTSLHNLRVLWLSRCGITDLDGMAVLEQLQELYISFNDIEDLTPISLHDHLEVLDLEYNKVRDLESLGHLGTCPKLTTLSLEGNPITRYPQYRRVVCHYAPSVTVLDDVEVEELDQEEMTEADVDALQAEYDAHLKRSDSGGVDVLAGMGLGSGSGSGRGMLDSADELGDDLDPAIAAVEVDIASDLARSDAEVLLSEASMVADSIKSVHQERFSPITKRARSRLGGLRAGRMLPRPSSDRSPLRAARSAAGMDGRPQTAGSATLEAEWARFEAGGVDRGDPMARLSEETTRRLVMSKSKKDLRALDERDSMSTSLTHGSGVVVAGNLARALRRRKTGNEEPTMSITETLDRTARLEKQSRETVIAELKAWDLDTAVKKLRRNPGLRQHMMGQRPGTSAGVLRSSASTGMLLRPRGGAAGEDDGAGADLQPRPRGSSGSGSGSGLGQRPPTAPAARGGGRARQRPMSAAPRRSSGRSSRPGGDSDSSASGLSLDPADLQGRVVVAGRSTFEFGRHRSGSGSGSGVMSVDTSDDVLVGWAATPSPLSLPSPSTTPPHGADLSVDVHNSHLVRTPIATSGPFGSSASFAERPEVELELTGSADADVAAIVARAQRSVPTAPSRAPSSAAKAQFDRLGEGVFMDDSELVAMLRKRPKQVPQLRNRTSYRSFFQGMSGARMLRLLRTAYGELPEADREAKVAKRMGIVKPVLTDEADD